MKGVCQRLDKRVTDKTNILVVYAAMIPTAKLVMDMMDRLIHITKGKVHGKASMDVGNKDIMWADVVLFIRGADPNMEKIARSSHDANRYCIMYLDDDLLNVPPEGENIYKKALVECLYYCDLLWSSNPLILEKYSQFMKVPKCVEEKVFEPIDEMLPVSEDTDIIRIVYAGSPSHATNIQMYIVPALNNIFDRRKNFRVTFIGLKEHDLNEVRFNAEYVSWLNNYRKYKRFIRKNQYHIGLAVVPDTEFSRCKFYNKFLEYSKMGVVGIYSDCIPYKLIVKDKINGFLCKNSLECWESKLEEVVKNSELRKKCVNNAQELLKKEFNIDEVLKNLIKKIPELCCYRNDGSEVICSWSRLPLYIRMLARLSNSAIFFQMAELKKIARKNRCLQNSIKKY